VRGVGSLYYLAYAMQHGVEGDVAHRLTGITLTVISASVIVHGVSVTPLMNVYQKMFGAGKAAGP
jgi:NhaP-type Na+/H+ or K+/H+ antiporter